MNAKLPSPKCSRRLVGLAVLALLLSGPTRPAHAAGRTSIWIEDTDSVSTGAAPTRLGYWRFNTSDWKGEQGQVPLVANAIQNVASFDGNALQITNAEAILKYRDVEANGKANINVRSGSIRFWYKPFWQSLSNGPGTGPGDWVRLVEMGKYTTNASVGWFSLSIDPTGTSAWFWTQNNLGNSSSFVAKVSFQSNTWYELTLAYSTNRVRLWSGDLVLDSSVANLPLPPAGVRAQGFSIGSATNGAYVAQGLIDEFETMNYPLPRVDTEFTSGRVLSAAVTENPPTINLDWRINPFYMTVVQRKLPNETKWISLITNTSWHYLDTNVVIGQRYDYFLNAVQLPDDFPRYLSAGISLPPVEDRGRVILLVDKTLTNALAVELNQLKQDLVGDGWTVIRHDVPRHRDDYSSATSFLTNAYNITKVIKPLIVSDYNTDPINTKAIFIVGHVCIPYSGFDAEDNHTGIGENHYGAWPADIYFGDTDGVWTDLQSYPANRPAVSYLETANSVGDGKFDQTFIPTNSSGVARLEMAVGRIDFARMPIFYKPPSPNPINSEAGLLRRYLNKDHRYRHKITAFPAKAVVRSFFTGDRDGQYSGIAYQSATRNCSGMFSFVPGMILEDDIFAHRQPCLWGLQGGEGGPNSISSGLHTSTELTDPAKEPPVAFYVLFGSWFGDWNLSDNFLRAVLATPNYGLASVWASRWRFEAMALGDTLGECLVRTANSTNDFAFGGRRTLAIMGDPTLRLHITAPVSNPIVVSRSPLTLAWSPSPETGVQYLVYRSTNGFDGPFTKLTGAPISATTYIDSSPPSGSKTYQVRAVKLTTTGSGSFTNLSQGIFVPVN